MIWCVVIIPVVLLILWVYLAFKWNIGRFIDCSTPKWLGGSDDDE